VDPTAVPEENNSRIIIEIWKASVRSTALVSYHDHIKHITTLGLLKCRRNCSLCSTTLHSYWKAVTAGLPRCYAILGSISICNCGTVLTATASSLWRSDVSHKAICTLKHECCSSALGYIPHNAGVWEQPADDRTTSLAGYQDQLATPGTIGEDREHLEEHGHWCQCHDYIGDTNFSYRSPVIFGCSSSHWPEFCLHILTPTLVCILVSLVQTC
jgi:hypothetical protein